MPRRRTTNQTSTSQEILSHFDKIDFSEYIKPYEELKVDYEKVYKQLFSNGKAWKVVYTKRDNLVAVVFAKTQHKATWKAVKYFRENCEPEFIGKGYDQNLKFMKTHRIPELDKYSEENKVPVYALMKALKKTYKCHICGQHNFDYYDYQLGKCIVLEGEGDTDTYTKGVVVCKECQQKYLK